MKTSINLQSLRGIAALIVVLMHCFIGEGGFLPNASPVMAEATRLVSTFGPAGVDLFFVISGFIIYRVAVRTCQDRPDNDAIASGTEFGLSRILRIYPIYWIVFVLALLQHYHAGGFDYALQKLRPSELAFFLLSRHNDVVIVAWTLAFEMYFYLFVTIFVFLFFKNFKLAFGMWSLLQAVLIMAWIGSDRLKQALPILDGSVPVSCNVLEFILGALVAEIGSRRKYMAAGPTIALAAILFVIGCIKAHTILMTNIGGFDEVERVIWYGLPASLLLFGMMILETRNIVLSGWLYHVGNASYSIYLTHLVVFPEIQWVAARLGFYENVPRPIFALAAAGLCTLTGYGIYRVVEAPLHQVGRRLAKAGGAYARNMRRSRGQSVEA